MIAYPPDVNVQPEQSTIHVHSAREIADYWTTRHLSNYFYTIFVVIPTRLIGNRTTASAYELLT